MKIQRSTKIIYSIIVSGLAYKTRLSFISSNSSFTQCTRKHNPQSNTIYYQDPAHTIITGADNHHFENATETVNDNTHTTPGHLELSSSATFTSCEWKKCEAEDGGALYASISGINLRINHCRFLSCEASAGNGSGIYAQSARMVYVNSSFFYDCNAPSGVNWDDGGGGIYLISISTEALITSSVFLSCVVQYDGGGVNIWNSHSLNDNTRTLQNCRIIHCYGTDNGNAEGGGFISWDNNYNVGISNTLFSQCSNNIGGAIAMSLSDPLTLLIIFCFFSGNTGNCGNDIALDYPVSDDELFSYHSFTTSNSHLIGYLNTHTWDVIPVNWLQQSYIYSLHSRFKPKNICAQEIYSNTH